MTGPEPNSGMERLPCGCRMGTVDDVFVFEPHSVRCRYYLYVLASAERQGKPLAILDLRGEEQT